MRQVSEEKRKKNTAQKPKMYSSLIQYQVKPSNRHYNELVGLEYQGNYPVEPSPAH